MIKKVSLTALVIAAIFGFSSCATFNAAKEPAKKCLEAWKAGDYETAYSYFADEAKANYSLEEFTEYAEANPVKKYSLNNVSISAEGKGTIKGSVTLKSGEKLGCKFEVVEISEGVWKIWILHAFSRDILMEE
ncbi:hypothetical protein GX441_03060 [bacterium]|nr:hypothetical protein [bacterium]